jgi:hypothetical protein
MPLPSWLTGRQELGPDPGQEHPEPKGKGRSEDERLTRGAQLVEAGSYPEAAAILRELESAPDREVADQALNLMADIDVREGNLAAAEARLR